MLKFFVAVCVVLLVACDSEQHERKNEKSEMIMWSEFGLASSVRLTWVAVYEDGGTVGFRIEDNTGNELIACIDGRLNTPYPAPFYLGATHPDHEDARAVKPWSNTEEALLNALAVAAAETLSIDDQRAISEIRVAGALPESVSVCMWQFVQKLKRRRAALRAVRSGEPLDSEASLRYFQAERPLMVNSIRFHQTTGVVEADISEDGGKTWTIELGMENGVKKNARIVMRSERFRRPLVLDPWGFESRATLVLLSAALSETLSREEDMPESQSPGAHSSGFSDDSLRHLKQMIEWMKAQFRAVDSGLGS